MPNILIEKSNGTTRIILNKPPVNVMDIALMRETNAALQEARADRRCKVIVIGAQGKLFSAGVDIRDHTQDRVEEMIHEFHALIRTIWECEQPTVAAVQGGALGGGCEIAMSCDFIVASDKAKFSQPEIQVGVFPPIAALVLPRVIPRKKALEMLMTGDAIDAQTAERLGLVNIIAPAEEFENAVNAFVARLTKLSGAALRLTKRAVFRAFSADPFVLRDIEQLYLNDLMKTADANEGLNAFLEKRAPVWKDA